MKKKKCRIKTGFTCLFVCIPFPTLLIQGSNKLLNDGMLSFWGMSFQGEAGLVVLLLSGLLALGMTFVAIYELGRSLVELNRGPYSCYHCDQGDFQQ